MRRFFAIIQLVFISILLNAQNDIDTHIGINNQSNPNLFVLVISNENYKYEQSVPFALNDGKVFKLYCEKTLGVPPKNIHIVSDATLNDMRMQLMWLEKVMKAYNGEAHAIFYYSGHGMPSENGKHTYLLPVDGNSQLSGSGLSTQDIYRQLGAMPSAGTIVLLDACFSGARRDGQMLTSSRGVAIKAKETPVTGNLVVFSAAQEDETAYPYEEKRHGLFTYYILSALQQKGGCISLGELADYVKNQVSRTSIVENGKSQTPSITASLSFTNWKHWMFANVSAKEFEDVIDNQAITRTDISNSAKKQPVQIQTISPNPTVNNGVSINFGFVDTRNIIMDMPEFSRAREEITALNAQYENNLQRLQNELQERTNTYNNEKYKLTEETRALREKELQVLYQNIQQTYQNNQNSISEIQTEKMKEIQSKVLNAIDYVGHQTDTWYVFEKESGVSINPVITTDLTQIVKYRLGVGGLNKLEPKNTNSCKVGCIDISELSSLFNPSDSIQYTQMMEKIKNAMDVVCVKYGFAFLLQKDAGVPYISPTYFSDVTSLVKVELNLAVNKMDIPDKTLNNARWGYVKTTDIIVLMPEFIQAKEEIENLYLSKRYDEQTLQQIQKDKMENIQSRLLNAIQIIGQLGNYAAIFELDSGIPFLNKNHSVDVTNQVKEKLGIKP